MKRQVPIALLILFGFLAAITPRADAAEPQELPTLFAYQIQKYAKYVNAPCPDGAKTIFHLSVRVADGYDGQFIDGEYGKGVLWLRDGSKLVEPDYPVPPSFYRNDYFWFADRTARVSKSTERDYVQFEAPGPNMGFTLGKLKRDCVNEEFGK